MALGREEEVKLRYKVIKVERVCAIGGEGRKIDGMQGIEMEGNK